MFLSLCAFWARITDKIRGLTPDPAWTRQVPRSLSAFPLLILALAAGPPVSLAQDSCGRTFAEIPPLRSLPGLKPILEELLSDPTLPIEVRRPILRALQIDKLEIVSLTQEVRSALAVEAKKSGEFRVSDLSYLTLDRKNGRIHEFPAILKRMLQGEKAAQPEKPWVVLAADAANPYQSEELLTLVHELSHARFEEFFRKNIDRLARRLPPNLISRDGRAWVVDREFYTYLQERYAVESALRFYAAGASKNSPHLPDMPRWVQIILSDAKANLNPALGSRMQIIEKTAKLVSQAYGIQSPDITALNSQSLGQILLGKDLGALRNQPGDLAQEAEAALRSQLEALATLTGSH